MANTKNLYAIKMDSEQLQMYLHFRKRGGKSDMKKGKGSYNRQEQKKMVKGWQEMTTGELANYLQYANPNIEVVLLDREKYERLLEKAKALDAIKNDLRRIYNKVKRID